MIKNPYGFVYITTNMIDGMRYIGRCKFNRQRNWKYYMGSGVRLLRAIKKYGEENFARQIVQIAYSEEELDFLEIEFIKNHNAVYSDDYYNIGAGGKTSPFAGKTKEEMDVIKNKIIGRFTGKNSPRFGMKASEETRRRIRETRKSMVGENNPMYGMGHKIKGDKNHFYGKKHTNEAKNKIAEKK